MHLWGCSLLLAATATAGSFKAEIDVETYVDANNTNQSFADSDLLWPHPRTETLQSRST